MKNNKDSKSKNCNSIITLITKVLVMIIVTEVMIEVMLNSFKLF